MAEKQKPLVRGLRRLEGVNEEINYLRVGFNEALEQYSNFPGYKDFEVHRSDLPYIDVSVAQKQLIDSWISVEDHNGVLKDAVQGRHSVKESLESASQVNTGLGRFFPRRKNDYHNQRVKELQDLIGDDSVIPTALKTRGVLNLDNPMNFTLYAITLGAGFGACTDALSFCSSSGPSFPVLTLSFGVLGLLAGGLRGLGTYSNKRLPWENAEYLDRKIQELF